MSTGIRVVALGLAVGLATLADSFPSFVRCAVVQPVAAQVVFEPVEPSVPDLIPTGVPGITHVKKDALVTFQKSLAAAEDDPAAHYDIVINVRGGTFEETEVYRTVMRNDPGVKRGDAAGVYLGVGSSAAATELTKEVLTQAINSLCLTTVAAPAIVAAGVAGTAVGTPDGRSGGCLGSRCHDSGGVLCGIKGSVDRSICRGRWHLGYACNLLRAEPAQFRGDPALFSPTNPPVFPTPNPYPDLTDEERAYQQHRDRIDYLKTIWKNRYGQTGTLTPTELEQRAQYARRLTAMSERSGCRARASADASRELGTRVRACTA